MTQQQAGAPTWDAFLDGILGAVRGFCKKSGFISRDWQAEVVRASKAGKEENRDAPPRILIRPQGAMHGRILFEVLPWVGTDCVGRRIRCYDPNQDKEVPELAARIAQLPLFVEYQSIPEVELAASRK